MTASPGQYWLAMIDQDPDLEVQVAVAKVGKYAVSESGDTVELIERPHGGLSLVLVDGQRSGKSAKAISNLVARKAVSLLADGVRDGAAARAAHDYLRTMRSGHVSATLNIVSIDLDTRTIVVSRNSHCPVVVVRSPSDGARRELELLDEPSQAIGIHARTRPVITELPIAPDLHIVVFTDGVLSAGERYGQALAPHVPAFVLEWLGQAASVAKYSADPACTPEPGRPTPGGEGGADREPTLADALLARAVELDQGRPGDDISVVVVSVVTRQQPDPLRRRRLRVCLPI
jgi:Stage II sporulation protein E (SpoIIE)